MSFCWDRFLIEGEQTFSFMIQEFKLMINDDKIRDFGMFDLRNNNFDNEIEELEKYYIDDIERQLIPWIYKEYESGRLFEKINWKPFRDLQSLTSAYLGYRVMFQYKQYYFQLLVDTCYHKNYTNYNYDCVSFALALYGWKDEHNQNLQPDNVAPIPSNNYMPEWYWEIK
jgi:hypothetical protein